MQKLALVFLFAVTFSMIFTFTVPALAQESDPETPDEMMEGDVSEEVTDEETMGEEVPEDMMEDVPEETMEDVPEEAMGEEMTDEELADDMMPVETMTLTPFFSPLAQLTMGVDPHDIECKTGQKLVFKATNWSPACINESSLPILSARGWVAAHDPTHEELAKMVEDHMAKQPQVEETPEEGESQVEVEEGIEVEEEASAGNGNSTEPEPQSHTIELREDMDMGAS